MDDQHNRPEIPRELLCGLCHDLLRNAVVVPCCANSYCDICIRISLQSSTKCPGCHENEVTPDSLLKSRYLRDQVDKFKNESSPPLINIQKPVEQVKENITTTATATPIADSTIGVQEQKSELTGPTAITMPVAMETTAMVPSTTTVVQQWQLQARSKYPVALNESIESRSTTTSSSSGYRATHSNDDNNIRTVSIPFFEAQHYRETTAINTPYKPEYYHQSQNHYQNQYQNQFQNSLNRPFFPNNNSSSDNNIKNNNVPSPFNFGIDSISKSNLLATRAISVPPPSPLPIPFCLNQPPPRLFTPQYSMLHRPPPANNNSPFHYHGQYQPPSCGNYNVQSFYPTMATTFDSREMNRRQYFSAKERVEEVKESSIEIDPLKEFEKIMREKDKQKKIQQEQEQLEQQQQKKQRSRSRSRSPLNEREIRSSGSIVSSSSSSSFGKYENKPRSYPPPTADRNLTSASPHHFYPSYNGYNHRHYHHPYQYRPRQPYHIHRTHMHFVSPRFVYRNRGYFQSQADDGGENDSRYSLISKPLTPTQHSTASSDIAVKPSLNPTSLQKQEEVKQQSLDLPPKNPIKSSPRPSLSSRTEKVEESTETLKTKKDSNKKKIRDKSARESSASTSSRKSDKGRDKKSKKERKEKKKHKKLKKEKVKDKEVKKRLRKTRKLVESAKGKSSSDDENDNEEKSTVPTKASTNNDCRTEAAQYSSRINTDSKKDFQRTDNNNNRNKNGDNAAHNAPSDPVQVLLVNKMIVVNKTCGDNSDKSAADDDNASTISKSSSSKTVSCTNSCCNDTTPDCTDEESWINTTGNPHGDTHNESTNDNVTAILCDSTVKSPNRIPVLDSSITNEAENIKGQV